MTGTWVIYQYKLNDGSASVFSASDTLVFTSATTYSYNGVSSTYSLYEPSSSSGYYLAMMNLYGTPFGSLYASPPKEFNSYGQMIGVLFTQISAGTGQSYYLWMKKI